MEDSSKDVHSIMSSANKQKDNNGEQVKDGTMQQEDSSKQQSSMDTCDSSGDVKITTGDSDAIIATDIQSLPSITSLLNSDVNKYVSNVKCKENCDIDMIDESQDKRLISEDNAGIFGHTRQRTLSDSVLLQDSKCSSSRRTHSFSSDSEQFRRDNVAVAFVSCVSESINNTIDKVYGIQQTCDETKNDLVLPMSHQFEETINTRNDVPKSCRTSPVEESSTTCTKSVPETSTVISCLSSSSAATTTTVTYSSKQSMPVVTPLYGPTNPVHLTALLTSKPPEKESPVLSVLSELEKSTLSSVIVPFGWHRIIEDNSVIYYSPNKTRLVSGTQVKQYLQREGTCKCGLECPVNVDRIFNFNPTVFSKPWTLDSVDSTEDLTKLCNHKRKIIAMATFQNSATLASKKIKAKGSPKKKRKQKASRYDGAKVSELLAEREKLSLMKSKDVLPDIPTNYSSQQHYMSPQNAFVQNPGASGMILNSPPGQFHPHMMQFSNSSMNGSSMFPLEMPPPGMTSPPFLQHRQSFIGNRPFYQPGMPPNLYSPHPGPPLYMRPNTAIPGHQQQQQMFMQQANYTSVPQVQGFVNPNWLLPSKPKKKRAKRNLSNQEMDRHNGVPHTKIDEKLKSSAGSATFLDNPTAFMAQQTALVNSSLSQPSSSKEDTESCNVSFESCSSSDLLSPQSQQEKSPSCESTSFCSTQRETSAPSTLDKDTFQEDDRNVSNQTITEHKAVSTQSTEHVPTYMSQVPSISFPVSNNVKCSAAIFPSQVSYSKTESPANISMSSSVSVTSSKDECSAEHLGLNVQATSSLTVSSSCDACLSYSSAQVTFPASNLLSAAAQQNALLIQQPNVMQGQAQMAVQGQGHVNPVFPQQGTPASSFVSAQHLSSSFQSNSPTLVSPTVVCNEVQSPIQAVQNMVSGLEAAEHAINAALARQQQTTSKGKGRRGENRGKNKTMDNMISVPSNPYNMMPGLVQSPQRIIMPANQFCSVPQVPVASNVTMPSAQAAQPMMQIVNAAAVAMNPIQNTVLIQPAQVMNMTGQLLHQQPQSAGQLPPLNCFPSQQILEQTCSQFDPAIKDTPHNTIEIQPGKSSKEAKSTQSSVKKRKMQIQTIANILESQHPQVVMMPSDSQQVMVVPGNTPQSMSPAMMQMFHLQQQQQQLLQRAQTLENLQHQVAKQLLQNTVLQERTGQATPQKSVTSDSQQDGILPCRQTLTQTTVATQLMQPNASGVITTATITTESNKYNIKPHLQNNCAHDTELTLEDTQPDDTDEHSVTSGLVICANEEFETTDTNISKALVYNDDDVFDSDSCKVVSENTVVDDSFVINSHMMENGGADVVLVSDKRPMSSPRCFNIGDLVWGQTQGFQSWPGQLVDEIDVRGNHKVELGKLWVRWFGNHTFTQVEPANLKTLDEGLEAHHSARKKLRKGRKMNTSLELAIQEAMNTLDTKMEATKKDSGMQPKRKKIS